MTPGEKQAPMDLGVAAGVHSPKSKQESKGSSFTQARTLKGFIFQPSRWTAGYPFLADE
jgi:hypothetical protein